MFSRWSKTCPDGMDRPKRFDLTAFFFLFLFIALGAAYGTAKSGTGIAAMSVMRPELIMKSIIPVVMAGILAIYGLVVAVLIVNGCKLKILSIIYCLEKFLHFNWKKT